MKSVGVAIKAIALWAVILVAGMATGMLFHWDAVPQKVDVINPLIALAIVDTIVAVVLTILAECMRLRGWRLGLVLALILFVVETALSSIEVLAFNNDLNIPKSIVVNGLLSSLLRDLIVAVVIALLWRKGAFEPAPRLQGLVWKPPVIAVLYIVAYFIAGILIVLPNPAAKAFYSHWPQIDPLRLLILQFGRGLVWCLMAFLLVRNLRAPAWVAAILTGITFAVLMGDVLLLPNAYMPWPVRCVHLVEIGASNVVFGIIAGLILLSGAKARSAADRP